MHTKIIFILLLLYSSFVHSQSCPNFNVTLNQFDNPTSLGQICSGQSTRVLNPSSDILRGFFDWPSSFDITKSKVLLAKNSISVTMNYLFVGGVCAARAMNSTIFVNDNRVMKYPNLDSFKQCYTYSTCGKQSGMVKSSDQDVAHYLWLNETNNLFEFSIQVKQSQGTSLYIGNVELGFCIIGSDQKVTDLSISNLAPIIGVIGSKTATFALGDPFIGLKVNNLTESFQSIFVVENNAIDDVDACRVTIRQINSNIIPLALFSVNITGLTIYNKLSEQLTEISTPNITKIFSLESQIFEIYNINLTKDSQLVVSYQITRNYEVISTTSVHVSFTVDAIGNQYYEIDAKDNSAFTNITLYRWRTYSVPFAQTFGVTQLEISSFVSDLSQIDFTTDQLGDTCWLQVNIQSQEQLQGTIHLFSNKTNQQTSIPITSTEWKYSSRMYYLAHLIIPSTLLECNSYQTTRLFLRLEKGSAQNSKFGLVIFKKNHQLVRDANQEIDGFISYQNIEEGNSLKIISLGEREYSLQDVIFPKKSGRPVDVYILWSDPMQPYLLSKADIQQGDTVTDDKFTMSLMPGYIVFSFEKACLLCNYSTLLTIPNLYKYPHNISPEGNYQTFRAKNFYRGVFWDYVRSDKFSNDTSSINIEVNLYNLPKPPPSLTLLVTNGNIYRPIYYNSGWEDQFTQSIPIHNMTFDCTQTSISGNARIYTSVPEKSGDWKLILLVDPAYTTENTQVQFYAESFSLTDNVVLNNNLERTFALGYETTPVYDMEASLVLPDCNSCDKRSVWLGFNGRDLLLDYQSYEIHVKYGQKPTLDNYDSKSTITRNSQFDVSYLFMKSSTYTLSNGQMKYVGETTAPNVIYIHFKVVKESIGKKQLCDVPVSPTSSYFRYVAAEISLPPNSRQSSVYLQTPIKLGTSLLLQSSNVGKPLNVDVLVFNYPINITKSYLMTINKEQSRTIPLNQSLYENNSMKHLRFFAQLQITDGMISENSQILFVTEGLSYFSISSTVDVQQYVTILTPLDLTDFYKPIVIAFGVSMVLSLLVGAYFVIQHMILLFNKIEFDYEDIMKNRLQYKVEDGTRICTGGDLLHWSNSKKALPCLIQLIGCGNSFGFEKKKTLVVAWGIILFGIVLFGIFFLLMGLAMYEMNYSLSVSDGSTEPETRASMPLSNYFVPCCYDTSVQPSGKLSLSSEYPLYCVDAPDFEYNSFNLTIDEKVYQPPRFVSLHQVLYTSYGASLAKQNCPNGMVLYVPNMFPHANTFGIIGIILGTIIVTFGTIFVTIPCWERISKKLLRQNKYAHVKGALPKMDETWLGESYIASIKPVESEDGDVAGLSDLPWLKGLVELKDSQPTKQLTDYNYKVDSVLESYEME